MKTSSSGFTIIELMAVVLISAILMAVAIPSFNVLIKNNRLTAFANELIGDIQFARTEAVRRGKNVRVSITNSGGGANEIGNGYTIWFDNDGDNSLDSGEELRVVTRVSSLITADSTGNKTSFTFNARGGVNVGDTWDICDDRSGETGAQITLLVSGLIRSTTLVCP